MVDCLNCELYKDCYLLVRIHELFKSFLDCLGFQYRGSPVSTVFWPAAKKLSSYKITHEKEILTISHTKWKKYQDGLVLTFEAEQLLLIIKEKKTPKDRQRTDF